jgi:hypothetical protein
MPPSRHDALQRNQLLIETAETRAARAVVQAYERARGELIGDLISRWTGPDTISPSGALDLMRRLSLLNQIDSRVKEVETGVGRILRTAVTAAVELAVDQVSREIGLLPRELRPDIGRYAMLDTATIERFIPIAMADIAGIAQSTISQLQSQLQTGLATGQSFPQLVRRLFAVEGEGGVSPWANGRNSAVLMARRTVITANNSAKGEALNKINEAGGVTVQKQVVASVGPRTTETCLKAHGQIRDTDQPFRLDGEPRFAREMMAPSFHWNCRTSIAMYHPAFERGGLTTPNMQREAAAELARREAAKRPARPAAPAPAAPAPAAAKVPPAYNLGDGARLRKEITGKDTALRAEYDRIGMEFGHLSNERYALYDQHAANPTAVNGDAGETLRAHIAAVKAIRARMDVIAARLDEITEERSTLARRVLAVPAAQQSKVTLDWDPSFKGKKKVTDLRDRVKDAQQFVSMVTADTPLAVKIDLNTTGRAFAAANRISIDLATGGQTIAHELGHIIESERGPAYRLKRLAFFDKRTAGDIEEKLDDLYPGWGYNQNEVTKKDKWSTAYIGKIYKFDSDSDPSSEIVSMGIERLYDSATTFAQSDPEYFDFIVSYLRGTL